MGWSYSPMYSFGSMKQFVQDGYNYENDNVKATALDYAVMNRTVLFVAVEQIIKQTGERIVRMAIVIFHFSKKEYGYKDMDESCGPGECNCPKRLLDLLTPTTNEFALQWRKRCQDYHLYANFKLKEGLVLIDRFNPSLDNTITLIENFRGNSWSGVYPDGRKFRWTKQSLLARGYTTKELLFDHLI